nr:MAG TPA: hypothetical protein [Caudoviricetes sp.]
MPPRKRDLLPYHCKEAHVRPKHGRLCSFFASIALITLAQPFQ